MLTKTQAKRHLNGILSLITEENIYLSCVRTYLRNVEVDVLSQLRCEAVTLTDLQELLQLQETVSRAVRLFLSKGEV